MEAKRTWTRRLERATRWGGRAAWRWPAWACAALLAGCAAPSKPTMYPAGDYFYVGGEYADGGKDYRGQMYVQRFQPVTKRFPHPVVMVHGSGQSGNNFLGTPDGRPGWATHFVEAGYEVYVVDQPARARSSTPAAHGSYGGFPVATIQYLLSVAPFPQSRLHTQWPGGKPQPGNAAFDQFMGQQVAFLQDGTTTERLNLAANLALAKRIGPAIYLMHSQSGAFGWALADAQPASVKALVQVEPNGPPFRDVSFFDAPEWYKFRDGVARPQGLTRLPLGFVPPVGADGLVPVEETAPAFDGGIKCLLQKEPAHRLPTLARVPIAIVTGEASFRATYDHCTSRFLTQAGVANTHIRLENVGVRGNSHMMMLELNNEKSAQAIMNWLRDTVR